MIKIENLCFSYGSTEVLKNINLKIGKGEFVAVIGSNGSGKSTLAKHLNALLLPTDGAVYVDGIDTRDEARVTEVRGRVGMVFQNPDNQLVASVVEDEAAFAPENLGVEPSQIRRRVDKALETAGLEEYAKSLTSALSGGQKQRLAVAAALTTEPECIVLDEVTSMLDPKGRAEVLGAVRALNREKGMTVILITHYMDEAVRTDRVIVLDKGGIALNGTPCEVFGHAQYIKEIGLDLPQTAELSYELVKSGIDIPIVLDTDALVSVLSELLGGAARD